MKTRQKEMRAAGMVTQSSDGYTLTEAGRDLFNHLKPLGNWAQGWTKTL
jgi:DNA-binding HxlR family transcriptional regulator